MENERKNEEILAGCCVDIYLSGDQTFHYRGIVQTLSDIHITIIDERTGKLFLIPFNSIKTIMRVKP